jgi:hypothetical protein
MSLGFSWSSRDTAMSGWRHADAYAGAGVGVALVREIRTDAQSNDGIVAALPTVEASWTLLLNN